jgi:hypothetical protein
VQPTDSEQTLNGYALRRPRQLDWEAQAESALHLRSATATFSQSVGRRQRLATPDRSKLKRELAKLMPPEETGESIDTSPIIPGDGWSAAVLPELVLLAEDDKITDSAILQQLGHRK